MGVSKVGPFDGPALFGGAPMGLNNPDAQSDETFLV